MCDSESKRARVLFVGAVGDYDTIEQRLHKRFGAISTVTVGAPMAVLDELAGTDDVDVIVSEYDLEEGDGLTLLQRVRERAPALPFVLTPATDDKAVASDAFDSGVTDYIPRSIAKAPAAVTQSIERAIKYRHTSSQLADERALRERITETAPGGVLLLDGDGTICSLSDDAATILGLGADADEKAPAPTPAQATAGQTTEELDLEPVPIDGEPAPDELFFLNEVVETGESVKDRRHGVELPDGRRRYLSVTGTPAIEDDRIEHVVVTIRDVTEHIERKRELERASVRIRALFDEAADPIYVFDENGRFVDASDQAIAELGYDRDTLLSMHVWDIDVQLDRADVLNRLDDIGTESTMISGQHRRADGSEFPVEITTRRVDVGDSRQFIAQARNVSERQVANERLEANVRAFRRLYEVIADSDRSVHQRIREVLDIGRDRLDLALGVLMCIDDSRQNIEIATGEHELIQEGESTPLTQAYCRKTIEQDGLLAVQDALAEGWGDDPAYQTFELGCYLGGKVLVDGELYGTICFADDAARGKSFTDAERTFVELLTQSVSYELEREQSQRELERQHDRFERTQRMADIGTWQLDVESETFHWTEGVRQILAVSPEYEPTRSDFIQFCAQPDRQRLETAIDQAIEAATTYELDVRVTTATDETRWVRTRGEPIVEDGDVVRLRGTLQDITEQKEREARLREQRQQLETILDHVPVALLSYDDAGVVTRVEGSVTELLGSTPDEMHGESLFALFADRPAICEQFERSVTGESVDDIVQIDDTAVHFWSHPIYDDSGDVEMVVGLALDVTKRQQRKQELESYERAINTAGDPIYQLDDNGTIVMVNDALTERTGYDRSELIGEHVSHLLSSEDIEAERDLIEDMLASDDQSVASHEVTMQTADGTPFPAESRIAVLEDNAGSLRRAVVVVRDITERKTHEETLTALHDVTTDLLRAESKAIIGDEVVDAAEQLLDFDGVGLFLFNESENVLEPISYSQQTQELLERIPTFGPGDGIAWKVFVEGEGRVYEDIRTAPDVHNPDTPIRTEVLLPLGDHGVLIAGKTNRTDVSDRMLELIQILAVNSEAALARVEREQALRERDRELKEKNHRLEQLNDINETIRRIDHALVGAETREEIEQIVCERLASIDRIEFAWIGEVDPVDEVVVPNAWGGSERGYLDSIQMKLTADEPAVTTAASRSVSAVDTVANGLRAAPWRKEALSREYLSVTAVPLIYDGVSYGVLSVYANRPAAFDEQSRAVFRELGHTVAHALNAVERKRALLSDSTVELEFALPKGSTSLFELVSELDCQLQLDSVLPQSNGTSLLYVTITGADPDSVVDLATDFVLVESARPVSETDDGHQFELHLTGTSIAKSVAEHGGKLERMIIDGEYGRVVVSLPDTADVRSFIDMFTGKYPDAELHARRRRTFEPTESGTTDSVFDRLTPRQTEAIQAAYYSGFFEWPRESTGEEIAESLDVSPPTFLEHLRRAEAKLVDAIVSTEQLPEPIGQ